MFIGIYTLDGETFNNIYTGRERWRAWYSDTFSPYTENMQILKLEIKGNNYQERKANAQELAKDWQYNFAAFPWSYGELAEIESFFYKVGERYGLIKEFRENAIL